MITKKKIVLVLSIIAVVALAVVIGHWRATTGLADFKTEQVADSYYVQDHAQVLQKDTVNEITKQNQALFRKNGGQIVVLTEQNLGGTEIAAYAAQYFEKQKIGSAAYNNGFLLVLAIEEENYYALPGAGLETVFTVEVLNNLITTYLEPDFAEKNYDSGVSNFFDQISTVMKEQEFAELTVPEAAKSQPAFPFNWVLLIVVFYLVLMIIVGCFPSKRKKRSTSSRRSSSSSRHSVNSRKR